MRLTFLNSSFSALECDDRIEDDDDNNIEYEGAAGPIDSTMHEDNEGESTTNKKKRGRINWITPRLTAVLDYTKTSDTNAMHILTATIDALKQVVDIPAEELVVNRTAIHELRIANRQREAYDIQAEFTENVI